MLGIGNVEVAEFVKKLLLQHKTVKHIDHLAYKEQYLIQCPACDGSRFKVWQPGDADYTCKIWLEAERLGLTNGL